MEAEICTLAGQIAAATSRFLRLLADFDVREGWGGDGIRSCAHWLSWRCGLDLRTAREHVRIARALTAMPRVAAAFDEGRVSYSKVRAISRMATVVALGRQRFRFHAHRGGECHQAPPLHGDADALTAAHGDIGPGTIEPDWDGSALHLHDAVAAYLASWVRRSDR